jgi:hypothetical protein
LSCRAFDFAQPYSHIPPISALGCRRIGEEQPPVRIANEASLTHRLDERRIVMYLRPALTSVGRGYSRSTSLSSFTPSIDHVRSVVVAPHANEPQDSSRCRVAGRSGLLLGNGHKTARYGRLRNPARATDRLPPHLPGKKPRPPAETSLRHRRCRK